jgi:anti-sigma factor RsiW
MRCRTAQRRLSDALDGALPPARQARLEAHLRACPDCRAYRNRARRLQERAALVPARPVASWTAFEAALEVRIDELGERPRPAATRRRRVLAWAAASASLLVGLAAWWMLQRPAHVRVETWTAYADVLDPLMMAAEADADTAGQVAREVGAQIEEMTPAPDLEALVLPAADPLFWEGLSEDELRGIVADLEKETAHGGPA